MPSGSGGFSILWIVDVDYSMGLRHGATLRYFHLSKDLAALGHRVHYAVTDSAHIDSESRNRYLDSLTREGYITGYSVFAPYAQHVWLRRAGKCLLHPGISRHLLRGARQSLVDRVLDLVRRLDRDTWTRGSSPS